MPKAAHKLHLDQKQAGLSRATLAIYSGISYEFPPVNCELREMFPMLTLLGLELEVGGVFRNQIKLNGLQN